MRLLAVLKAITGNLDLPGGDLFSSNPGLRDITEPLPPAAAPPLGADTFPLFCRLRREAHALALPDAVLEGRPYPIRAMIIAGATLPWSGRTAGGFAPHSRNWSFYWSSTWSIPRIPAPPGRSARLHLPGTGRAPVPCITTCRPYCCEKKWLNRSTASRTRPSGSGWPNPWVSANISPGPVPGGHRLPPGRPRSHLSGPVGPPRGVRVRRAPLPEVRVRRFSDPQRPGGGRAERLRQAGLDPALLPAMPSRESRGISTIPCCCAPAPTCFPFCTGSTAPFHGFDAWPGAAAGDPPRHRPPIRSGRRGPGGGGNTDRVHPPEDGTHARHSTGDRPPSPGLGGGQRQ